MIFRVSKDPAPWDSKSPCSIAHLIGSRGLRRPKDSNMNDDGPNLWRESGGIADDMKFDQQPIILCPALVQQQRKLLWKRQIFHPVSRKDRIGEFSLGLPKKNLFGMKFDCKTPRAVESCQKSV